MLCPGNVVVVRFPYTESKGYKWRPALVVSSETFHKEYGLCWVAMITSADNPGWTGDVPVKDLQDAGLLTPSSIRPAKVATVQCDAVRIIGRIATISLTPVLKFLYAALADNR